MTVRGPPGPPGGGGGGSALSPSDSYCGCNATAVRSIVAGAVGGSGRRVRRVFKCFSVKKRTFETNFYRAIPEAEEGRLLSKGRRGRGEFQVRTKNIVFHTKSTFFF